VVLPSNFFFYPWKELGVKLVKASHQAKFNAAAANNSLRMLVETVSSLISQSAYDLTAKDFTWLLYWLRRNSYTKSQMMHVALCSDPTHLKDVDEGRKPNKSLETIAVVNNTSLKETGFDPATLEGLPYEQDLAGLQLGPPRMRDLVELVEAVNVLTLTSSATLRSLPPALGT
jgi:hypothetical protein